MFCSSTLRSTRLGRSRLVVDQQRPDPDALLARIQEQEASHPRLRIYLGAAPGVGKTYTMLEESHRRRERGADIVVGFVETHGRPRTAKLLEGLEVLPPKEIIYKGITFHELDTDAVIARHPAVTLVDELAHSNVPGSKHEKRYQDVLDLLNAGISVITTMNVQHIESLNDTVRLVTGVSVAETVPDWIVDKAEQIELIDMDPQALIRRMMHGNIYPAEQAKRALDNFFTVSNLTALREIALRVTAREVGDRLTAFMDPGSVSQGVTLDKVMVAVDHRPVGKTLIRSGRRMAAALKSDLVVVHVEPRDSDRRPQSLDEERHLRANLHLADDLGATVVRLSGDVAEELVRFIQGHDVAHLIIGHPSHSRMYEFLHGSVTSKILRAIPEIDVHLVARPPGEQK